MVKDFFISVFKLFNTFNFEGLQAWVKFKFNVKGL